MTLKPLLNKLFTITFKLCVLFETTQPEELDTLILIMEPLIMVIHLFTHTNLAFVFERYSLLKIAYKNTFFPQCCFRKEIYRDIF